MKRSELFARVWSEPLTKVAAELGVSDVGLAKACVRHDVPRPGRGYWAKLAVGKAPPRPALPSRPTDPEVVVIPSPKVDSDVNQVLARRRAVQRIERPRVDLQETLTGCSPLVRVTAKHFATLAKEIEAAKRARPRRFPPELSDTPWRRTINGRHESGADGLRIVATLRNIDWILRFHDALIRTLALHGCKVAVLRTTKPGSQIQVSKVEVRRGDEAASMSFAEEYETRVVTPRSPLASGKEYVPKDTYKLKIEREFRSAKIWSGNEDWLTHLVPEIASELSADLTAQAELRVAHAAERAIREAAARKRAEASRIWFAEQEAIGARKASQKAQIDRAKAVANAYDEFAKLSRLISQLEPRAGVDAALQTWLSLVRPSLIDPTEALIRDVLAESQGEPKPLWWPTPSADE